jgi:hypothetical protein
MNVAQHAENILAAWNLADPARFEQELDSALRSCQRERPANYLESEQREVLESVVERLRSIHGPSRQTRSLTRSNAGTPQSLNAGFALLEHLRQRTAA